MQIITTIYELIIFIIKIIFVLAIINLLFNDNKNEKL
jgi:hypothetical protein